MPPPKPPPTDRAPAAAGPDRSFDVRTSRALGRTSRNSRLLFAAVYATLALSILPLWQVCLWVAVLIVWELVTEPLLDWMIERLSNDDAISFYGVANLLGSGLFSGLALMALTEGSPVGIAVGATWMGGAFMNAFVYFGANRRMLWSCLIPGIAVVLVGPALAHGVGLTSTLISTLILAALVAAQSYALDHRTVVRQLADRQIALTDMERRLAIAVEASGDGLFEADLTNDEWTTNNAWCAMLGYAPGEMASPIREWRPFVHPDDLAQMEQDYRAHLRGEIPHTTTELRMRCKDGSYKWVLNRARLVSWTPEGRPWRLVGTNIDISARKALEHQLESARDLAESANRAKSIFVANMSHEIRTPLNGVIGVAGALARTKLTSAQREMVSLVQSSGQVLERMLSDILDQAKIEAGNFQLQVAPFDLREEIDAAAELMRARAEEKGLAFHLSYADDAQGLFEGDAMRIRQIVSNLASNAIKFSSTGAVTVTVDATAPALDGEAAQVTLKVSDTGIGFDAETADRLFGRFVQADGSISRQFGGSGLGLAICRSLTDLMGGRIEAVAALGTGSTFTVELPLRRVAMAEARAGRADAPAGDFGKVRILLAEDHPTNQRVVQLILEPAGVELTIVNNGQEAVETFAPGRFDLILMDMQMPVMDGLTATGAIRDMEREAGWTPTRIAMFTANAMDEHLTQAVEAGANSHIAKPITPERLLAGVAAALRDEPVATPARAAT